jgi:hypothetical protein
MAGPLPDLDVSQPGPIPTIDAIDESSYENVTTGRVLSDLQTGFMILLALSVPFIVYVLSWKAGFGLANLAYATLVVLMVGVTVLSWAPTVRYLPEHWVTRVLGIRKPRWVAQQVVPLIGFELWRHAALSSFYVIVPLVAIAWSFIATIG